MVSKQSVYLKIKSVLHKAGIQDVGLEARLLIENVTHKQFYAIDTIGEKQAAAVEALAQKRATRYPLQYILGSWPFMGLQLAVGPGVLAPRPETELVCEAAIQRLQPQTAPVVLDLCAGTGALALGVQAALPQADITAVEYSEAAYRYLQANCKAFLKQQGGRVPTAVLGDALSYYNKLPKAGVDMMLSNPPYVTEEEYKTLAPELWFEPKDALVAQENGLLFYRAIARHYKPALKPGGFVVFEIGAGQGPAVRDILQSAGYIGVQVQQDYAGLDRIALGQNA